MTKTGARIAAGRFYAGVNRAYFDGRLPRPKFHIVDNGAWATAERREYFGTDGSSCVRAIICIHPLLAKHYKLLCRELLHEIVHIAWPKLKHGAEFERRMIRIRAACIPDQLF